MSYQNSTRKLPQIVFKLFVVVFFSFSYCQVKASDIDSNKFNNHIIGLSGSSFRLPYGQNSQGNYIPTFSHKIKADYSFRINSFLMFKSGITYQYSDTIFSNIQNTFLIDGVFVAHRKKIHLDVGLHIGTFSVSIPPFNKNGPIAQYLSVGAGITLPFCEKWAFDLSMRYSINITLLENSYLNIPEGFIGIQYSLNGNNSYLRKE